MHPRSSFQLAGPGISNEISASPHPAFSREGRRISGFLSEDDGVMPVFYRQRMRERIALQRADATRIPESVGVLSSAKKY